MNSYYHDNKLGKNNESEAHEMKWNSTEIQLKFAVSSRLV